MAMSIEIVINTKELICEVCKKKKRIIFVLHLKLDDYSWCCRLISTPAEF